MAYTKVVIVGGGFGGLNVALWLKKAPVDILLIDRTNHHVFQPLLYQVATAALSSGSIAYPIRAIVRNQPNCTVIMEDVNAVNKDQRTVMTGNGDKFTYDYLILAPGARHAYFGHPEWERYAPGLKTIEDAVGIREKILLAYELAERCDSMEEAASYLRFVVIGGGPTGVEMAGAIAEIAHLSLLRNFRKIKPENTKIFLLEGASQILPSYPASLGEKAKRDLEKLGVKVYVNTFVTDITSTHVCIGDKSIQTYNVIWAAGNEAAPVLKTLGVPLDHQGRAIVEPDMSIPGHPELFVIGDAAAAKDKNGAVLPGVAPVAIQQGRYVAKLIEKAVPVKERTPFAYHDKGSMATIGKAKAVAVIGRFKFSGLLAWLAWSLIHIVYLINFANRLIVMTQWTLWYLTGKRNVRVITKPIDEQPNVKS